MSQQASLRCSRAARESARPSLETVGGLSGGDVIEPREKDE